MIIHAMLVQPMSARDQTISLSSGPLAWDTKILIPADAEPEAQEHLQVCGVLSKTQARVVRGVDATIARAYPRDTIVGIATDGLMHEVIEEAPVAEPDTVRPNRRQALDIAATIRQAVCPTCGCPGGHT